MSLMQKVQPCTFQTLPWVAGIDTLSDLEWLQSNPDGKNILKELLAVGLVNANHRTTIAAITRPLRNLVKLMLGNKEIGTEYEGMLNIIEIIDDAPVWNAEGRRNYKDVLRDDLDALKKRFPSVPRTLEVFIEHVHADAEYWLAKKIQNEKGGIDDA